MCLFLIGTLMTVSILANTDQDKAKKEKKSQAKPMVLKHTIVVTASRSEQLIMELGSSVSVISAQELKNSGKENVLSALQQIRGLDVSQSGGLGKESSIFIRGANSEHSLVLLDGIELNDPISPGRSFDLAHFTLDNIERVEIVRGPQSTLYGSDAMGGVVQMISKKGVGKPKLSLSFTGGSYNSFSEFIGLSGSTSNFNYSFGISRIDSQGFSASHQKYGNTEKDGYNNTTFSTRLGFSPIKNMKINFIARYILANVDLDGNAGTGGDDPNYISDSNHLIMGTSISYNTWENKWNQKLTFSLNTKTQNYSNEIDQFHPADSSRGFYKGNQVKINWQHNIQLHRSNTIILGIEYENERGESEYVWQSAWGPGESIFPVQSSDSTGFYVQENLKFWDQLFVSLGIRYDHQKPFGGVLTYRFAPAFFFKTGTKIKATYGTGFKAPSLYQLYAPASAWGPLGNPDLFAEESIGWDLGIEQYLWGDQLVIGLTYFNNQFENLIVYDWSQGYININQADTTGIECYLSLRVSEKIFLRSSYTYCKTEDKATGEQLLRRPDHKVSLGFNCQISKKLNANLDISYVGERSDVYPYPQRTTIPEYTIINSFFSYQLTNNLQLTLRIDNLLDTDYEVVKGYGVPGRSFYIGFNLRI